MHPMLTKFCSFPAPIRWHSGQPFSRDFQSNQGGTVVFLICVNFFGNYWPIFLILRSIWVQFYTRLISMRLQWNFRASFSKQKSVNGTSLKIIYIRFGPEILIQRFRWSCCWHYNPDAKVSTIKRQVQLRNWRHRPPFISTVSWLEKNNQVFRDHSRGRYCKWSLIIQKVNWLPLASNYIECFS